MLPCSVVRFVTPAGTVRLSFCSYSCQDTAPRPPRMHRRAHTMQDGKTFKQAPVKVQYSPFSMSGKGGATTYRPHFHRLYFRFRCDSSHGRTLERARVSSRSHFIPHPSQRLSCIFRTPPYPSALSPRVLFSLSSTHTQHRHVVLRSPNKRGGFRCMSAEIC